jgi:hypothetical protein
VSSHDDYGTSRELFFAFFGVIADTLRDVLGSDWSGEIENAWNRMLDDIKSIVIEDDA